ncbi:hypothetical protein C0J52_09824 [Blattella germanica]|nr:hypothetical protein C0J52_09824 [Blattella germanica]
MKPFKYKVTPVLGTLSTRLPLTASNATRRASMDFEIGSIANLISGSKSPSGLKGKGKSKASAKVLVNFKSVQLDKKNEREDLHKIKTKKRAKSKDKTEVPSEKPKKKKYENDAEERPTNAASAEKRIERKNKEMLRKNFHDIHSGREIFVGNVPIDVKKKKLVSLFSKYGEVETVRLRSAPLSDPRIPKKVAVIKKKFHPDRSSLNAYIRFVNGDSVNKAIAANGMLFKDHHLRVTTATEPAEHDKRKTIFIGNCPFDAEDEDLWKMFGECGTITSVRIVRDKMTGVSRGFAYVNFESADNVELALKLDGEQLKKRMLRVKRCTGQKSNPKAAQKRKSQDENDFNEPKKKKKKKLQGEKEADSGKFTEISNRFKKSFQGQKAVEKEGKIKVRM